MTWQPLTVSTTRTSLPTFCLTSSRTAWSLVSTSISQCLWFLGSLVVVKAVVNSRSILWKSLACRRLAIMTIRLLKTLAAGLTLRLRQTLALKWSARAFISGNLANSSARLWMKYSFMTCCLACFTPSFSRWIICICAMKVPSSLGK